MKKSIVMALALICQLLVARGVFAVCWVTSDATGKSDMTGLVGINESINDYGDGAGCPATSSDSAYDQSIMFVTETYCDDPSNSSYCRSISIDGIDNDTIELTSRLALKSPDADVIIGNTDDLDDYGLPILDATAYTAATEDDSTCPSTYTVTKNVFNCNAGSGIEYGLRNLVILTNEGVTYDKVFDETCLEDEGDVYVCDKTPNWDYSPSNDPSDGWCHECDDDCDDYDDANDPLCTGGDDCDDDDPDINPSATEICGDGIDQDCSGADLECSDDDADDDGHDSEASGGDDCDDTDADINPDAEEIPGNDVDENCDGRDGTCTLSVSGAATLDANDAEIYTVTLTNRYHSEELYISTTDGETTITESYPSDRYLASGQSMDITVTTSGTPAGDYVLTFKAGYPKTFGSPFAANFNPAFAKTTATDADTGTLYAKVVSSPMEKEMKSSPTVTAPLNLYDWVCTVEYAVTVNGTTSTETDCSDGVDNDGDGAIDCDDTDCVDDPACAGSGDIDDDGDGYYNDDDGDGDWNDSTDTSLFDCDDTNADVNPGEAEACSDGIDNDCDGAIDETQTWYADADGDAYGDSATSQDNCDQPTGYVADNTDCDDTDPDINPAASEVCGDDIDQDCSGADETCAPEDICSDGVDNDGDGEIDCDDSDCAEDTACTGDNDDTDDDEDGYYDDDDEDGDWNDSTDDTILDCDDTDDDNNPAAAEVCEDGEDNDCDGETDEGCIGEGDVDDDGDGYCEDSAECADGSLPGDCDDNDDDTNPAATEVCEDEEDNDCDGEEDEGCEGDRGTDDDGDGYCEDFESCEDGSLPGDCDDANPDASPAGSEAPMDACTDGLDLDCDGFTCDVDPDVSCLGNIDLCGYLEGGSGCGCDLTAVGGTMNPAQAVFMLLALLPLIFVGGLRYRLKKTLC